MTRVHQKAKKREKGTVYFFAPAYCLLLSARQEEHNKGEQRGQFTSSVRVAPKMAEAIKGFELLRRYRFRSCHCQQRC